MHSVTDSQCCGALLYFLEVFNWCSTFTMLHLRIFSRGKFKLNFALQMQF